MKAGSKRGAALAIVIVVSAAILILSAALISAAAHNISSTQNGQEGRQAYLDAKSAIEYGKAYVSKNPGCGDFTVLADSTSGSGYIIKLNGKIDAPDTLAAYDGTKKSISAQGKYKSSDRIRKLGYQFNIKNTGNADSLFWVCSLGYGKHEVFTRGLFGFPTYLKDGSKSAYSDYPVIVKQTLSLYSLSETNQKLIAPKVFLMNSGVSLYCSNESGEIQSDFIYIAGDINGEDYRDTEDSEQNYCKLLLNTNHESSGVICFGSDCRIRVNGWGVIHGEMCGAREILIKKGYYSFTSGTDLFGFTDGGEAPFKPIANKKDLPAYVNDSTVQYISKNVSSLYDGDSVGIDSAFWTRQGQLSHGAPTDSNILNLFSKINKRIVYLYVSSCYNWEDAFLFSKQYAIYLAREINLQFVNDKEDFVLPASKTVIFSADNISLNTQSSDSEAGSADEKPVITFDGAKEGKHADFILTSTNGAKEFDLICPNDLKVCYSDSKQYVIKKGIYHIKKCVGIGDSLKNSIKKGVNLFTDDAKDYFDKGPDEEYGDDSGSTIVAGGEYTDGQ
ncbi:MAG TPA: hypothetical protein VHO66_09820 [Ruminiclostridium sp.]|nr:hypothetical protein [Ruminiclostridium sp.]